MNRPHLTRASLEHVLTNAATRILLKLCTDAYGTQGIVTASAAMAAMLPAKGGQRQRLAYEYSDTWSVDLSAATCADDVAAKLLPVSATMAWTLFSALHRTIWQLGGWRSGSSTLRGLDVRVTIAANATYTVTGTAWYTCSRDACDEARKRRDTFAAYVPPRPTATLIALIK